MGGSGQQSRRGEGYRAVDCDRHGSSDLCILLTYYEGWMVNESYLI